MFVGLFGVLHYANAEYDTSATTTTIGNQSPVFTTPPSDGGSHSGSGTGSTDGNPTDSGDNVTFTATAHDVNSDSYYLAICRTESITVGNNTAPTCTGGADDTWVISGASNDVSSDAEASITYTAGSNSGAEGYCTSAETCGWLAFVCDKVASGASCFPAVDAGDEGYATGTITFADVPVDAAVVTIDSKTYEFDLTDGSTCAHTPDVCMNASGAEDGADAAKLLYQSHIAGTIGSTFYDRGAVVYVYATNEGVGGNSIAMSETYDTGNDITVDDANLAGGDNENANPFYINHPPTFGTVTIDDSADGSSIAPGDTVRFTIAQADLADADTVAAQDTINMYVCSGESDQGGVTSAFNYSTNTCTGGTLLCSDLGVNPTSEDATCNDTTASGGIVSVPTAHATDYTVKVYVEDIHSMPASSGTNSNDYTVIDVVPVFTAYSTLDTLSIPAGGSDTMTYGVTLYDDNGDNDVTDLEMVFFEDTSVNNNCSADDNDCIIEDILGTANCEFKLQSTPGSGKTALGTDKDLGVNCDFTVWFNATAGNNWEVHAKPTDGLGQVTSFSDSSNNNSVDVLQGVDVVEASIAYGTVAIGGTSVKQVTSMGNVGNQILDMLIDGTDMTDGGSGTIVAAYQKYAQTSAAFDWDDAETDPGPWILETSAGGTDESTGCINRDIAVRDDHSATTTNESIWWKIRIPASQTAGSYTGTNTFTTTTSSTCSGGTLN